VEEGNEEGEYQSGKDREEPKYRPPVPDISEDTTKYGTESLFVDVIRKRCGELKRNFTGPSTNEI
jgi:hypothetical protein